MPIHISQTSVVGLDGEQAIVMVESVDGERASGYTKSLHSYKESNTYNFTKSHQKGRFNKGKKRIIFPKSQYVGLDHGQAIVMVESVDGERALLGASKAVRGLGNVLTCLSGFIEQCESIEEAVRREVREEAGVPVGTVHILGSQPWPIGAPVPPPGPSPSCWALGTTEALSVHVQKYMYCLSTCRIRCTVDPRAKTEALYVHLHNQIYCQSTCRSRCTFSPRAETEVLRVSLGVTSM